MSQELRYWERVGMYVTKDFAEQWAEKLEAGGDSTRGKYLDDEVEEYIAPVIVSSRTIRREIEELFSKPFEEVELPPETQAILAISQMEKQKVKRIKDLKAEGYSLQEAKELVSSEINLAVAEIMGIDLEEFAERQEEHFKDVKGAEAQEASVDDGEE